MAEFRTETAKYTSSTTLGVSGYALTWQTTPVYKELILATTNAVVPVGISTQTAKQNDNIGYALPGATCKAVAAVAIAIGTLVTPTTAGKFTVATKITTAGTTPTYVWGIAVSAAGAADDIFELLFQPFEMQQ